MKLKVVAFLQCLWAKNPQRVGPMLDDMEARYPADGRERLLRKLLFIGGLTGSRLTAGLGEEWCRHIVWEESTRQIAGHASGSFPPDPKHMQQVLLKHSPQVVLLFGKVAQVGYGELENNWMLREQPKPSVAIALPHPAARGVDCIPNLRNARERLDWYNAAL